jgi:thymidylate synthase (FAD)
MKKLSVKRTDYTTLLTAIEGIRTCWRSDDKSDTPLTAPDEPGKKDRELVERIIKMGHTSTLEHIRYTFWIDGISRACLQELARHRHASMSVESTRYCLKRLVDGDTSVDDLLVPSGNDRVDFANKEQLRLLRNILEENTPNDVAKYMLPEAFAVRLTWSINARSLRNFLQLRTAPRALPEIQRLAHAVYANLPHGHHFIFHDVTHGRKDEE